jgi:hypothetical protein
VSKEEEKRDTLLVAPYTKYSVHVTISFEAVLLEVSLDEAALPNIWRFYLINLHL